MFDVVSFGKCEIGLSPFIEDNTQNKMHTLSLINAGIRHVASKFGVCKDVVKIKNNHNKNSYITKATAINWILSHKKDEILIEKSISCAQIRTILQDICAKKNIELKQPHLVIPQTPKPSNPTPPSKKTISSTSKPNTTPLTSKTPSHTTTDQILSSKKVELSPEEKFKNFLKKAQEHNDVKAKIKLSKCYFLGKGIEANPKTAKEWAKAAADQGDPKGQWFYANCLLCSNKVTLKREGLEYLRLSASKGYSRAKDYLEKAKVEVEEKEAFEKCKQLAEKTSSTPKEKEILAGRYIDGKGTPVDNREGVKWLLKADAEGELCAASYRTIGIFYEDGEVLEKDSKKAFNYLLKAAIKRDMCAQKLVGLMFLEGTGEVRVNTNKALNWLIKASNQGDPLSSAYVGFILIDKKGTLSWVAEGTKRLQIAWNLADRKTKKFVIDNCEKRGFSIEDVFSIHFTTNTLRNHQTLKKQYH